MANVVRREAPDWRVANWSLPPRRGTTSHLLLSLLIPVPDLAAQVFRDPAFLLQPEELPIEALKAEGVQFEQHLVRFSVREPAPAAPDIDPEEYYVLLANAADFVVERLKADVVFVAMENTDIQHSQAVVAHMKNADRG
jgi:hypothetical protein